jgi:hypothetical protein
MMSSALEVALAQLFRKKGKSSLTEKELVFAASLDLRWFTPKEAQKLIDLGLESELLQRDRDKIKPGFDHKAIDVPVGYKPGKDALKSPVTEKSLFMKIVEHVAASLDLEKKEVISQVNAVQEKMHLEPEVAALMVARELDVDVQGFLDAVEEEVGRRYRN